jgi:hypothetical protein
MEAFGQSSLVLQRVDAMDLDEIWSYNRHVLPPALSIYLDERRRHDRGPAAPSRAAVTGWTHRITRAGDRPLR